MFGQIKRVCPKKLLFIFLILVAFGSAPTVIFSFQSSPATEEQRINVETQKRIKLASVQHDLILALIDNKSFDQVESEWRKVLDLRLGAKFEGQIADSLLLIAYNLSEAKQMPLALKIIDQSLSTVPFSNKSKADIFTLKAHIYVELGDSENAIKAYQTARDLLNK